MTSVLFMVVGGAFVVGGAAVFLARRLRLPGTVLLAAGALALVSGWLMAGGTDRGEALKTGGLAAGSVVALYALWLNDRRRQVDEERQELEHDRQRLESDRASHDRQRAADERFLRAVELLGDDTDQVRVGALHALAGLARSRSEYAQDVLDVLCSYLRQPFDHPRWAAIRHEEADLDLRTADRWLQVRLTAQRLIADLLPPAGEGPTYDLDLHGASLEYLDVSGRAIGQLRARQVNLYESNSFRHCEIRGPAWFTGARSWGRLYAHDMVFRDRSWFSRFTADGLVDFARTAFHGATKFAGSRWGAPVSFEGASFGGDVDLTGSRFADTLDLRIAGAIPDTGWQGIEVATGRRHHLPPGWGLDRSRGGDFAVVLDENEPGAPPHSP